MADTTILLRDGNNSTFPVKARLLADGSYHLYHASQSQILLPDASAVDMVGTTMSKFSDGFSGPTLTAGQATLDSLTKWTIPRNTGMTIQQVNGALVITTGTTSGNEFMMVGNMNCTIPQNLIVALAMTARSANQETRIGYVEVDPLTGQPVPNANLVNFFNNHTAVLFNGTTTTTVMLETLSGSNPTTKTVSVGSQTASTSTIEYALEVRPEDVTYQQALADSVVTKVASGGRVSTMVPSPNTIYAPFIWVRNTGTATSNVITIQRVISMDIQELQVEVGGGRGNLAASQAIPVVQVASGTTQNVIIANAAVSTSSNSGSVAKVNNAATNSLTAVKGSAGKVWGGYLFNNGTTPAYLRLFNATSAGNVNMGTTAPIIILGIPAGGSLNIASVVDQYGLSFTTGIVYAITAGSTDLDNTAMTTANQVVGTILFV